MNGKAFDEKNVHDQSLSVDSKVCFDLSTSITDTSKFDEQQLCHLINKIIDQDQLAFSRLYDMMLARVYGLALRITRCVQSAEEVVEDTFWQVWCQAPRFDPMRGNVISWIMTIARSRALDALRQVDKLTEKLAETTEITELASFFTDNPQDLLAAIQEGNQLHQALAALDPVTQQLIALSFFRGLSHEEIAVHSQLPLGSVKSQIRRALISLKQVLGNEVEDG
jgi:RNA polymerase sigma-70 factor (ECF subfamily)